MANGTPSPGPNGRPMLPAGGMDLEGLKDLTPEKREVGQFKAEMESGMRCRGCGKRIDEGVLLTQFKADLVDGVAVVRQIARSACVRPECDYHDRVRVTAHVAEPISFAWLDEAGVDAPVPEEIAKQESERRERVRERPGSEPK